MEQENFKSFPFVKEDIDDKGIFTGYASTFGGKPDSYGDVIVEGAFTDTLIKGGKFGLGIVMLSQHEDTIGIFPELSQNKKGLKVKGQIAIDTAAGKDTYILMKLGAINAMSIGWEPLLVDAKGNDVGRDDAIEYDDKKRIRKLKKIDLWEISPVTFPANPNARITDVKEAIENARDVRQLEHALKDSGLSNRAARYLVSLCRPSLKNIRDERQNDLRILLNSLQTVNAELVLSKIISSIDINFNR